MNPPKKLTIPPSTAAKLCALNLFFGRNSELQIHHGNFLLMDNKHRKLVVMKQSKGCKFTTKCIKIRLAAGLRADPLGELTRSSRPSSRNGGGLLLRGGKEGKGREGTYL